MTSLYAVQNARKDVAQWNKPDPASYQKIAFLTGHCLLAPNSRIADMGCGWGEGSFHLAHMNPHVTVYGIDIDPRRIASAHRKYGHLPNLHYQVGNIERADELDGPFDAFLNSSVLHHIYSYNLYDTAPVERALKNQYAALKTGGLLVLRDFMAWPLDLFVSLTLRHEGTSRSFLKMSDADLLSRFSRQARSLLSPQDRGFFLEETASNKAGCRSFSLPAKWAAEFCWRKDYRSSWSSEVQEEYSFWTSQDYGRVLSALGGRVIYRAPFWNPWIVENRFKKRVEITDEAGEAMGFPPTNYVALVEKVAEGESLFVGERAPVRSRKRYLVCSSYRHTETGERVDMAARPGGVKDYLPFARAGDALTVWAKCGYPRPLVNAAPRGSATLDGKVWSGHCIEPIAIANIGAGAREDILLAAKLGCAVQDIGPQEQALTYYPCIGFSQERVTSCFVERKGVDHAVSTPIDPSLSGFSTSGDVRAYDAQVLLRAAHVGILPEARLELNLYALMRHQAITPDPWMHGKSPWPETAPFVAEPWEPLHNAPPRQVFVRAQQKAGYLRLGRSLFEDRSAQTQRAAQIHDFVLPVAASTNLGVVLPIARDQTGALCLGLQIIDTPAHQEGEGTSRTLVAPSFRLPFAVQTMPQALDFMARRLGATPDAFSTLGDGYFASIGMTRERCYPFMVNLRPDESRVPLHYVRLSDVFAQAEAVRDASLLIGAFRAIHALGVWDVCTAAQKNSCANKITSVHCSL